MEWKTVKLGEICKIFTGKKDVNQTIKDGLFPFFSCAPTPYRSNDFIYDGNVILVAGNGSFTGRVSYYSGKFDLYQRTYACVPIIEDIDFIYLYFYMKALFEPQYMGGTRGSSIPYIVRGDLSNFEISLPPIETQRRIAAILSSLDDKIENNNRINRNLEAQAQALFKSWFVDFEPWGGTMPEDWKEYQLTEFAEIISGYSYKGAELMPSEDAMATIKNFDRKGYFKLDGYKEIQISGRLKNSQILNLFDVIVAHTDITQQADIIGNPAIILSKGGYRNIIMSMDLCKVQPTHYAISSAFLYCLLKDNRFKSHALGYVNGTTVLHMSKKALPEYRVFLPNDLSKVQELGDQLQNLCYRHMCWYLCVCSYTSQQEGRRTSADAG